MTHHICINHDYLTFDGEMIPFGKKAIEKDITKVISDILDIMVPRISNSDVYICGTGDARRMLGRKLEDRLKRVVKYT